MVKSKGLQTTEFWLAAATTAASLCVVVASVAYQWDLSAALLGTATAPAMTYIGARSAVKGFNGGGS